MVKGLEQALHGLPKSKWSRNGHTKCSSSFALRTHSHISSLAFELEAGTLQGGRRHLQFATTAQGSKTSTSTGLVDTTIRCWEHQAPGLDLSPGFLGCYCGGRIMAPTNYHWQLQSLRGLREVGACSNLTVIWEMNDAPRSICCEILGTRVTSPVHPTEPWPPKLQDVVCDLSVSWGSRWTEDSTIQSGHIHCLSMDNHCSLIPPTAGLFRPSLN